MNIKPRIALQFNMEFKPNVPLKPQRTTIALNFHNSTQIP